MSVRIAKLRIYFTSKTYFLEYHSQDLYKAYYMYTFILFAGITQGLQQTGLDNPRQK